MCAYASESARTPEALSKDWWGGGDTGEGVEEQPPDQRVEGPWPTTLLGSGVERSPYLNVRPYTNRRNLYN